MKAFHSSDEIKTKYLARLHAHRVADHLIRGKGWENGKGCAVGCTLEQYSHVAYETELGIPRELAGLEDQIFEGLPLKDVMEWPEQFLSVITPGADLTLVWHRFAIWLLSDPQHGTIKFCDAAGRAATQQVTNLHEKVVALEIESASSAAWSAANYAASYAAISATSYAASYAAWSAASSAENDAGWSAASYAASYAASSATSYAAYIRQRDKLLELLNAEKP